MKNIFFAVAVIFGVYFPAHANNFASYRTDNQLSRNFIENRTQFFHCKNDKKYFLNAAKTRVQKFVDLVNSNTADYENGAGNFTGKKTAKSFFWSENNESGYVAVEAILEKNGDSYIVGEYLAVTMRNKSSDRHTVVFNFQTNEIACSGSENAENLGNNFPVVAIETFDKMFNKKFKQ